MNKEDELPWCLGTLAGWASDPDLDQKLSDWLGGQLELRTVLAHRLRIVLERLEKAGE